MVKVEKINPMSSTPLASHGTGPLPENWAPATGPALPLHRIEPDPGVPDSLPVFLAVDHCLPIASGFALLQGWVMDPARRVARLEAGANEAFPRIVILPSAMRHSRHDVDEGLQDHYAPFGLKVPQGMAHGYCALVPLSKGAQQVPLVVHWADGGRQTWELPVRRNEAVGQKLLTERGRWFGAAMAPLCTDPQLVPVELLRLLELTGTGGHPDARLEIDVALRIESGGFISGWGMDVDANPVASMFVLTGDPHTPVLIPSLGRIARPDVIQHLQTHRNMRDPDLGFLAWLPGLSDLDPLLPWTFVTPDGNGGLFTRQVALRQASEQDAPMLLHSVPLHNPSFRSIYDRHTGPALEAFYDARRSRARPAVRVLHFGTPVAAPEVSILVPLYGRWDFMEYQIAQFRHDPSLARHELIYYVDDPAIYDDIVQYWRSTHPLYEFPFTLAFAGENLGFAGANNAAASCARGRLLLLLNSDVIPTSPGWLPPLVAALDQQPRAGVVGPTLLYGDGSVQHAGMTFERYPHWGYLWTNLHPGKGWPADWVASELPREVAALTGACMLIDRGFYDKLGGLDEGYIRGDFEDSDLCMKIRAAGYLPYLVPQVTLYHLERQSQDINARVDTRSLLTIYNCWRHTRRWDAALERVSTEVPA